MGSDAYRVGYSALSGWVRGEKSARCIPGMLGGRATAGGDMGGSKRRWASSCVTSSSVAS